VPLDSTPDVRLATTLTGTRKGMEHFGDLGLYEANVKMNSKQNVDTIQLSHYRIQWPSVVKLPRTYKVGHVLPAE
jgi:hypothetical protein